MFRSGPRRTRHRGCQEAPGLGRGHRAPCHPPPGTGSPEWERPVIMRGGDRVSWRLTVRLAHRLLPDLPRGQCRPDLALVQPRGGCTVSSGHACWGDEEHTAWAAPSPPPPAQP